MELKQHSTIKDVWLDGPDFYKGSSKNQGNRYDIYVNPPGAYLRTPGDKDPIQAGYIVVYPETVFAQFHPTGQYHEYIGAGEAMVHTNFDPDEMRQALEWIRVKFYEWLAESILRIAKKKV